MASSQYTFVKKLGSGGQGDVWEAVSPQGHKVAVKVYRKEPTYDNAMDDAQRRRFLREIKTQSALDHPHIVKVIQDGLLADGNPFYVMAWADETLESLISKYPTGVPADMAMNIFAKICDAMRYAHSEQVLHRDLKPQNILLYSGEPKIADFGLGRQFDGATSTMTQSHLGWGSPKYMAPEQAQSLHDAQEPADVWSLGKILFELLTGKVPIWAVDAGEVPDKFKFIISRCNSLNPSSRFKDAIEMAGYVAVLTGDDSFLAPPAEQAKAAIQRALSGDSTAYGDLAQICLANPLDSQLYGKGLSELSGDFLEQFAVHAPDAFKSVVLNYCQYVDGDLPFSFCDLVADFLESCFEAYDDYETRAAILDRMLRMGQAHNRWYVARVFARVTASASKSASLAQLIASLLNSNEALRDFAAADLRVYSLPQMIVSVLDGNGLQAATPQPAQPANPWGSENDPWGSAADSPWGKTPSGASNPWAPASDNPWGSAGSPDEPPF